MVSLGLVALLLGLSFWFGTMHTTILETKQEMESLSRVQYRFLLRLDERLSRIEGSLGIHHSEPLTAYGPLRTQSDRADRGP